MEGFIHRIYLNNLANNLSTRPRKKEIEKWFVLLKSVSDFLNCTCIESSEVVTPIEF